ncbi:hypothetical protein [Salinarimonas sp.]|uniref:hypothetical protein n=1 Tax=Salinarimonas sp. TaxID=2766526 RepID=UPI0032D90ADD
MSDPNVRPPDARRGPGLLAWLGLALLATGRRGPATAPPPNRPLRTRGARRPRPPRASWGAILAGAVLAGALLLLLGCLGAGLVLLTRGEGGPWLFGSPALTGAGALLAQALALGLGGWVAARWAAAARIVDGVLHGALAWALVSAVIAGLVLAAADRAGDRATLIASAGIAGAAEIAAGATNALGRVAAASVDGVDVPVSPAAATSEAADLARQAVRAPEETLDDLARALAAALDVVADPEPTAPRGVLPGAAGPIPDDTVLTELIAQQTGAPPLRAVEGVAEWRAAAAPAERSLPEVIEARVQHLRERARAAAARAAEPMLRAAAIGALSGGVLLLVGALAAVVGGALAGRR